MTEYDAWWEKDSSFSEKMMPQVKKILDTIEFPKRIQDNVGTHLDLKGYDLTIKPLQIGVRLRRYRYKKFDEFTEDDKEKDTMTSDYYFFGYATPNEEDVYSYLLFNHKDFEKHRSEYKISRQRNEEHSDRWFTTYPLYSIYETCQIIGLKGPIAWKDDHKMCKWSGEGYIKCVPKIREKRKVCLTCSDNPDLLTGV